MAAKKRYGPCKRDAADSGKALRRGREPPLRRVSFLEEGIGERDGDSRKRLRGLRGGSRGNTSPLQRERSLQRTTRRLT